MLKFLQICGKTGLSELCNQLSVINITSGEHVLNILLNASHDLLAIIRALNITASIMR